MSTFQPESAAETTGSGKSASPVASVSSAAPITTVAPSASPVDTRLPAPNARLRVIITGATGMVGEGILHECLQHPAVEAVLILNRKSLSLSHPKLKEVLHGDFYDLSAVESQLSGYNACFFCLGVSSVGMPAGDYYKATYTLTMNIAETLSRVNNPPTAPAPAPSAAMVFCYVSGAGTDSSEKGRSRWARVKGKTENDLMKLPFRRVYAFRPGFIRPIAGLQHAHKFYKYINWLFPIGRALFPGGFVTLSELGLAMIHVARCCDGDAIVEGKDIIRYAVANSSDPY